MKTSIFNLLMENRIADVIGGNFTHPVSIHNSLSILKFIQNSNMPPMV